MSTDQPRRSLGSTDLKRLNRDWRRRTDHRLGLVLDSVGQPFNVGAIVRTAAAYRVGDLWVTTHTADPEGSKAGRTGLGTVRFLDVHRVDAGADAVAAARTAGYRVLAVELTGDAQPVFDVDLTGDVCLVLGHEDHGVSRPALAAVDGAVYLPLPGRVGSLNVAAAAAAACAEVRRQQWTLNRTKGTAAEPG